MEKALLHVFARSAPYTPVPVVHMEEVVDGEKVQYNIPSELSDHLFRYWNTKTLLLDLNVKVHQCLRLFCLIRKFLCSDSIHPVRLVQDFLLAGLAEDWSVSMTTEPESYLVAAKRLQTCCHGVDASQFYWIHQLQKDLTAPAEDKDPGSSNTADASDKESRTRKGAESLRSVFSLSVNPEVEGELYLLRPSLLLQLEELLTKREEIMKNKRLQGINEGNKQRSEAEMNKGEAHESRNGIRSLFFGFSGVVFRNVPVSLWAPPAFHQLLLRAVVPSHTETMKKLGQKLEKLLAPYGVSMVTEEGALRLTAQPMGLVGQVFVSDAADTNSQVIVVSLNLDLLAVILFSLPDWRLLWCHDSRFIQQFSRSPPPGTPFRPFSLFPESFSFDISFWSGPAWEEKLFHAAVREASLGTVEQVKLIDMFSHPDLSQTSFCYRLTYRSHTHAVSHTQALTFHKQLQLQLTSRLQLTIR